MRWRRYLPGDLLQVLNEVDRFEDGVAALVTRDVAQAIAFIHGKHIAHRDIKPENILYRGDLARAATADSGGWQCCCKLADFGTATFFKDVHELFSERLGTSCYVAPEVLKQKYYPAQADMWSLGATVFMMLAGEAPFYGPFQDLTRAYAPNPCVISYAHTNPRH